jgi:tRNA(Ile)-lysidine synthase
VTSLVAVSGGPDSVALLRALARLRPGSAGGRIIVAHYNHRWRGAESDEDEAFVVALARSLDLTCEVGRALVAGTLRVPPAPQSEDQARNERYAFLLATAHRVGARYVALGHTADDQAETTLFRLLRGTGVSGLTGMPQSRQLSPATTLIRPLLSVRRSEVLNYLGELGQNYRTDASNNDVRFARNRLRQEVLPALQELSAGDVVEQFLQLGRQAAEIIEPLRREAEQLLDRICEVRGDTVLLHLDRISNLPSRPVLREMCVELWRRRSWPRGQMTNARWEELAEVMVSRKSPVGMFPGGLRVIVEGSVLRAST